MRVDFSPEEVKALWDLAYRRQQAKRGRGARDKRFAREMDNVEMHYKGIVAEAAVAKVLGLKFDDSVRVQGPQNRVNLALPDGRTVHVRWTQLWLFFNALADFTADLAIVVNPADDNNTSVYVVGWIDRQAFKDRAFTKSFRPGHPRVCVRHDALRPMAELVAAVKATKETAA